MLKSFFIQWGRAFQKAFGCLALALKDLRHDGLWWRSSLISFFVINLWLVLYYMFPRFFLTVSGYTSLLTSMGALSLVDMSTTLGGAPTVSNMANVGHGMFGMGKALLKVAQVALYLLALGAIFYVVFFAAAVQMTMGVLSKWLLSNRIEKVIDRRHPTVTVAALDRPNAPAAVKLRRLGKTLLLLCIPVWTSVMVLYFLLTLNVRHIFRKVGANADLSKDQSRALIALGFYLSLAVLIPVFNLLVPGLLYASVWHLHCSEAEEGSVPQRK